MDQEQVSDRIHGLDLESWNQICPVNELRYENTKRDFFSGTGGLWLSKKKSCFEKMLNAHPFFHMHPLSCPPNPTQNLTQSHTPSPNAYPQKGPKFGFFCITYSHLGECARKYYNILSRAAFTWISCEVLYSYTNINSERIWARFWLIKRCLLKCVFAKKCIFWGKKIVVILRFHRIASYCNIDESAIHDEPQQTNPCLEWKIDPIQA